jgi:hypothetical protein
MEWRRKGSTTKREKGREGTMQKIDTNRWDRKMVRER